MDILLRIRLAFWLLVIALWGTLVYQFISIDSADYAATMQWLAKNPFPRRFVDQFKGERQSPSTDALVRVPRSPFPQKPPLPDRFIKPIPPKNQKRAVMPGMRQPALEGTYRKHEYVTQQVPTPSGFYKSATRHFIVFSEGEAAPQRLLDTIESLHANLMLDLAAFSPWARDEQVSIYLFRSQESYRQVTGRPPWSGGASSISRRKIYLYGSEETIGILAHELCHIYFDSFFAGGVADPLWLSEGMATLVQIERGLASPNWLPENLNILYAGGGFHLNELMKVESTASATDSHVRLWYTQSYSVVRFLIRSQWKSSFYRFSKHLREGKSVDQALTLAYGMPFTRIQALEYAWRYDLETHRITSVNAGSR